MSDLLEEIFQWSQSLIQFMFKSASKQSFADLSLALNMAEAQGEQLVDYEEHAQGLADHIADQRRQQDTDSPADRQAPINPASHKLSKGPTLLHDIILIRWTHYHYWLQEWASLIVLALPIIVYSLSLFTLYRAKVNTRVKVSDFFFILAALIIVGNILSIAAFKRGLL